MVRQTTTDAIESLTFPTLVHVSMHDIDRLESDAIFDRGDMTSKLGRIDSTREISSLADGKRHQRIEESPPTPEVRENARTEMDSAGVYVSRLGAPHRRCEGYRKMNKIRSETSERIFRALDGGISNHRDTLE